MESHFIWRERHGMHARDARRRVLRIGALKLSIEVAGVICGWEY